MRYEPSSVATWSVYERGFEAFGAVASRRLVSEEGRSAARPAAAAADRRRVSSVYPAPVMLLTTTGAKTGQPRTLPLLYVTDGDGSS